MMIGIWKIMPALVAGCGVVLKPSLANDSTLDLGASLWTRDLSTAMKLIPRIDAGTI